MTPKRASKKRAPRNPEWPCMDCGTDTYATDECYMLKDTVWRRINPIIVGMLCLPCAEERLCRPLYRSDFSTAPINALQAQLCLALAERLLRPRPKRTPGSPDSSVSGRRQRAKVRLKKMKNQSRLGAFSAALLQHSRPNGRVPRKAFVSVLASLKWCEDSSEARDLTRARHLLKQPSTAAE
jgi:hypothetical protein